MAFHLRQGMDKKHDVAGRNTYLRLNHATVSTRSSTAPAVHKRVNHSSILCRGGSGSFPTEAMATNFPVNHNTQHTRHMGHPLLYNSAVVETTSRNVYVFSSSERTGCSSTIDRRLLRGARVGHCLDDARRTTPYPHEPRHTCTARMAKST